MESPLYRLYKTKFVLASFISVVAGYILMAVGNHVDALPGYSTLKAVNLHDIGIVLMTSGLVVMPFTFLGNKDVKKEDRRQNREDLRAETPTFVASVIDAIANTPEQILSITAPDVLDRVIENSLAARIHDRELAHDVYADLRDQIVRAKERWYDVRVSAVLSPWEHGPESGEGSMFVATVKWEFRVTPANPVLRFACVSDMDEYRELLQDPSSTGAWYFKPIGQYDAASPEVFELLQCSVNGKPLRARRTTRRGSQLYTVSLGDQAARNEEVTISYTHRTLAQRNGHFLYLELAQPTKGFAVQLHYGGCGIQIGRAHV